MPPRPLDVYAPFSSCSITRFDLVEDHEETQAGILTYLHCHGRESISARLTDAKE